MTFPSRLPTQQRFGVRKQLATLCLSATLGTVLVGCNSKNENNNSSSTATPATTSSASSSTHSSTASTSMKSTTDESEDNQPNPDSDRSDTDAEEQENNADTADQGAADVPSWVVGHWYGHRRFLNINPDGSGSLIIFSSAGLSGSDQAIQLIDSSENGGRGTMTLKVVSSRDQPDPTGKIYDYEVENGVAGAHGYLNYCKTELPEYKAEYGTRPMCGG